MMEIKEVEVREMTVEKIMVDQTDVCRGWM